MYKGVECAVVKRAAVAVSAANERAANVLTAAIACAVIILAASAHTAYAYDQMTQYIRIGLYYNSGIAVNAAAPTYQTYSDDGISVGFSDAAGEYKHLYDFKLIARTDVISPSSYSFGKRYAVVTGRDTGSLADMAWRSEELLHKGYDPQLAYIGGWVLITGLFDSRDAALNAAQAEFAGAFPKWDFHVDELVSKYILITLKSKRQFIFDTGAGNLRLGPTHGAERDKPYLVELNGKQYRGEIEFIVNGAGGPNTGMTAVNVLTMDEYLYGVVPRELEASSAAEALKAQAVAARTYTINNLRKHGASGFDLCGGVHCQVYGGYSSEDARAAQAVDETSGELVLYNAAPAEVFYFSSSGGRTESVKNVWNSTKEYPYLVSVEDNYESGKSLHYYWHTVYSAKEIEAKLAADDVDIGNVTGIAVTKTSEAGSVVELTITGTTGKKVYTKESCRIFMDNIYSQRYSVFASEKAGAAGAAGAAGESGAAGTVGAAGAAGESGTAGGSGAAVTAGMVGAAGESNRKTYTAIGARGTVTLAPGGAETVGAGGKTAALAGNGGTVISETGLAGLPARGAVYHFVGTGWGHGVGMSQEGAKGMALAGFSYKEILTHYFTGCTVGVNG